MGLAIVEGAPAPAADTPVILAQAQDQDRDRDRDRVREFTEADRDRIRQRLRDGSCQEVARTTDDVLGLVRECLDPARLRDGSCEARIGLGLEALERTRERCRTE